MKKLGAVDDLFNDMDLNGSGIITRCELRSSFKHLGIDVSEDVVDETYDSIDLDNSGDIDPHEFAGWMEHNVSRLKMATVVLKIITGLGQVMSKQEDTMEQKLPGPQWNSDFFSTLKFDVGTFAPICEVDYSKRFLLTSVAMPVGLVLLVAATWAMNPPTDQTTDVDHATGHNKSSVGGDYDENAQSKRSDYYFVFFLVYPTMTETWFNHFNCRQLPDMHVLQADYAIRCWEDTEWWLFASISAMGLILVSFGVPTGMYIWMRRDWKDEMHLVKTGQKSGPMAYRDFGRKYDFVVGDFRPQAYYAESLDLVRKLFMTGIVGLIAKGTVFQSFCSVLFGMTFMILHVKLWPYPHTAPNLLKLFADLQVVLVSMLGLALRFDDTTLQQERFGHEFYGNVMFGLLVATAVPAVVTIFYKTPVEKVLHLLHKLATVDTDKAQSKVALNRITLQTRRQTAIASRTPAKKSLNAQGPRPTTPPRIPVQQFLSRKPPPMSTKKSLNAKGPRPTTPPRIPPVQQFLSRKPPPMPTKKKSLNAQGPRSTTPPRIPVQQFLSRKPPPMPTKKSLNAKGPRSTILPDGLQ
eukprot:COSAG02_NODE_746_length_17729_cov_37.532501_3_plen_579_part_00